MLAVSLGLVVLAAPPDLRASPAPVAGGDDDQVDILQPEDGTYYPDVPSTVDVAVEVTNDSALEIQDVSLEVNGVAQEMTCDGAGTCEWSVTLEEGMHEFRGVVVRNIGGPLFSQFVEIQVGGDPPGADGGTAASDEGTSSGGEAEPGTTSSDGGEDSDGGDASEPSETDDANGCACRASRTSAMPASMVLLGLVLIRRRRRL